MSNSNGVIAAPVSIGDVATVLSVNSSDLGTLCVSNTINRWARYKPERWAGTTAQAKLVGHPQPIGYSTRKMNNFSLEVPYCNDWRANVMNVVVHDFVSTYGTQQFVDIWNYLKPRGDQSQTAILAREFYRLSDFARLPGDTNDIYNNTIYGTGYNHAAKLPINVSMDDTGCRFLSGGDYWYYEVNIQVSNKLVFTFFNSPGDDLHLQDFVTIPENESSITDDTVTWRPVVQVFNQNGTGNWWDRHNADYEIAGDAITSETYTSWQVEVNLNDSNFSLNQYYHVCIGLGYCKKDLTAASAWGGDTNCLFVPPYTTDQADNYEFPFYCVIRPVSYAARHLFVDTLQYHVNSPMPAWVTATGTPPYFEVHSLMEGTTIHLTMRIEKNDTTVDFVSQTGTPQSGYTALRIQAREMISGTSGETTLYLTPANPNSNWAETHYIIPTGDSGTYETIYAKLEISNIPLNEYGWYHLWVNSGGSQWDNIGYFSIQKIRYTSQ